MSKSAISSFLCLSLCAVTAGATFNVVDFGARVTDCLVTTNIQAAIDACHRAGGGEVVYALARRSPIVARAALTDFIRASPHTPAAVAGAQEALRRLGCGAAQGTNSDITDPTIENDNLKIAFGGEGVGFGIKAIENRMAAGGTFGNPTDAKDPDFEVTIAALKGDWWQAARLYKRCPWEIGHYPEYFPTVPHAKETITYLQSIGQEPMVYTLPRLYSETLLSWHCSGMRSTTATRRISARRKTTRTRSGSSRHAT